LSDGPVDTIGHYGQLSKAQPDIAANALVRDGPASALHPGARVLQRLRSHVSRRYALLLLTSKLLALSHQFEMFVSTW
jgi:hypothetical protein